MDFLTQGMIEAIRLILRMDRELVAISLVSVKTATLSTVLGLACGVPIGAFVALARFFGQRVASLALNTLMAIPTVVVGLLVYSFLSRRGPLGSLGLLYTQTAMVIGQAILITPLVAILQSPWRQVHILTIMLSYAILLVALCLHAVFLGVVLFGKEARTVAGGKVRYSPLATDLNDKAYYMVAWGFFFLTIGIATGAAWGNASWGRYWGWDSKEVWATVAWAIYALFLHLRLFFRVPREALAVINIIGYAAILFTYFGVSYLLPGLHAYS